MCVECVLIEIVSIEIMCARSSIIESIRIENMRIASAFKRGVPSPVSIVVENGAVLRDTFRVDARTECLR